METLAASDKWKKFDFRGALEHGVRAERLFARIARGKGKVLKKSTPAEDQLLHVDYWMMYKGNRPKEGIDVKAIKRIDAGDAAFQDRWIWVELQGVEETKGWLFGGEAVYVAFEMKTHFIIVRREALAGRVNELVDWDSPIIYDDPRLLVAQRFSGGTIGGPDDENFVKYQRYTRRKEKRNDILTLIDRSVLYELKNRQWDKPQENCYY